MDKSTGGKTSEAVSLKEQALTSAQALLDKYNKGTGTSAVGTSRIFGLQKVPGTAPYDFEVQFNNLKSLLSLENVKLLKGQGQVSDAERKLLAEASAKLDLGQSEEEFAKSLQVVIDNLSTETGGNNNDNTNSSADTSAGRWQSSDVKGRWQSK